MHQLLAQMFLPKPVDCTLTVTGKRVASAAASHLAKVSLELGGKSPNIVFDDADLDAAAAGSEEAQLGLDIFISETRRHLGGLLVELGGADAIVFTGGIGENGREVRQAVCSKLSALGIELCEEDGDLEDSEWIQPCLTVFAMGDKKAVLCGQHANLQLCREAGVPERDFLLYGRPIPRDSAPGSGRPGQDEAGWVACCIDDTNLQKEVWAKEAARRWTRIDHERRVRR